MDVELLVLNIWFLLFFRRLVARRAGAGLLNLNLPAAAEPEGATPAGDPHSD